MKLKNSQSQKKTKSTAERINRFVMTEIGCAGIFGKIIQRGNLGLITGGGGFKLLSMRDMNRFKKSYIEFLEHQAEC